MICDVDSFFAVATDHIYIMCEVSSSKDWRGYVAILLWIFSMLILYFVIYSAVKDGIDKSEVGKLIKKKYRDQKVEREMDDRF